MQKFDVSRLFCLKVIKKSFGARLDPSPSLVKKGLTTLKLKNGSILQQVNQQCFKNWIKKTYIIRSKQNTKQEEIR